MRTLASYLIRLLLVLSSASIGHVAAIICLDKHPFAGFNYSLIFDITRLLADGSCSILGQAFFAQTIICCLLLVFKRLPLQWFVVPALFYFGQVFIWLSFCFGARAGGLEILPVVAPFFGQFIICFLIMAKSDRILGRQFLSPVAAS